MTMKWDGRVGPAAILAFGIAVLQGLSLIAESRADIGNRLVRLEVTTARAVTDLEKLSSYVKLRQHSQFP